MYELFDDICDIMREYDVTFSLGDGLRPGGLADATDEAQLAELRTLGELTERAWAKGVPGHDRGPRPRPVRPDRVQHEARAAALPRRALLRARPARDRHLPRLRPHHQRIGATAAAYHGASMLCYVTPKEHLGLPKKDDVKQGCVAYKIAAHAADVALGIPGTRDRDDELTKARAALNWEKHFELSFDPDTRPRVPRRGPRRGHGLLRHVRPRLVLGPDLEGDRGVRVAARPTGFQPEKKAVRSRRRSRPSSRRSSRSAASCPRRRSTSSRTRGRRRRATRTTSRTRTRRCRSRGRCSRRLPWGPLCSRPCRRPGVRSDGAPRGPGAAVDRAPSFSAPRRACGQPPRRPGAAWAP